MLSIWVSAGRCRSSASDEVGWPSSFVPHSSHNIASYIIRIHPLFIHEQTTCQPHTILANLLHHSQLSLQRHNLLNQPPCHMRTP